MSIKYVPNGITEKNLQEIFKLLSKNDVCAFSSSLGSGKSTVVPEGLVKFAKAKVFCTQNTILACKALYNRMKKNSSVKVGYAAEGEVNYDKTTEVVYCTSGHLFKLICSYMKNGHISNPNIDFCSVLMIDEAHTGDLHSELIMLMWIYLCKTYKGAVILPKVLITSATFSLSNVPFVITPDMYLEFKGKTFPVEIEYNSRDYYPSERSLYKELGNVIKKKHSTYDKSKGTKWIVFCPGKYELSLVENEIKSLSNTTVIKLFSGIEDMEKIFSKPKPGQTIIIIATNIAETSVTIPDLEYVFDSGTEKINSISTGNLELKTMEASKSSIDQRTGRVGRTAPGKCFRMFTEKNYNSRISHRESEINRLPLSNVFLDILKGNVNPVTILSGRLSKDKIEKTTQELEEKRLVRNGKITRMGKVVSVFPMSINNSICLNMWINRKKPAFPGIVAVSIIEKASGSYFSLDKTLSLEEQLKPYSKWLKESALETYLSIFVSLFEEFETIDIRQETLKKWCVSYKLNFKLMSDCLQLIKRLCSTVHFSTDIEVEIGVFRPKSVVKELQTIFEKVYSKEDIYTLIDDAYQNGNGDVYKISNYHPVSVENKKFSRIVALSKIIQYKSSKSHTQTISFFHPLE